ncbi:lipoprotein [Spiroplasma clarkii]|nr:lipoprotein [Spiroplasma clarkii]
MKKLLLTLASVMLITSTSVSVVSCGTKMFQL